MRGPVAARSTSPEPEPSGGEVIPIDGRQRGHAAADEAVERIAVVIESLFQERGRTLADPATAEAFDVAMDASKRIVDAVQAEGHLPEDAYRQLLGWLETARCAPAVVGGE